MQIGAKQIPLIFESIWVKIKVKGQGQIFLFVRQQLYGKTAAPICMKFSEEMQGGPEQIPLNFGSIWVKVKVKGQGQMIPLPFCGRVKIAQIGMKFSGKIQGGPEQN